jgi:dTDP-4-amino-4,6-dideoxygalactose transaminase
MITVFPYKIRLEKYKKRYISAFELGIDTISDWLRAGPTSDNYTPSRQKLKETCQHLSSLEYWHFVHCASDALQLCISVLTKPNDKIIMPAYGFIAVPQSALWINRQIVFVDTNNSGLIDKDSLKSALVQHPDAKLLIAVHLFGRIENIKEIKSILPKSVKIIEDAANAFYLPEDECEPLGSYSEAVCYSFDMAKSPGGIGVGGAVASRSYDFIDRIKESSQQGYTKDRTSFVAPAKKSSLDDTSCRIIDEDIKIMIETDVRRVRRANHDLFARNINQKQLEGQNIACMAFGFFPSNMAPAEARKFFADNGVQVYTNNAYPCFPLLTAFNNCFSERYTNAQKLASSCIITPCHEFLTTDQKDLIITLANQV